MDLLAFERKLDQTIARKRMEIQEAIKKPITVSHTPFLLAVNDSMNCTAERSIAGGPKMLNVHFDTKFSLEFYQFGCVCRLLVS